MTTQTETTPCHFCKFMGERHTASNAIAQFTIDNFRTYVVANAYLGWKHRKAPQKEEWLEREIETTKGVAINANNTLFVLTIRNPLSWLRAMHREPYCWHQPELKGLPFKRFLMNPIEDYRNPIVMWNEKYRSYLRFADEVPYSIFLSLEEFRSDQYAIFKRLKKQIPAKGGFSPMVKYVSGEGVDQPKKLPEKRQRPRFSDAEKAVVDRFIDHGLVTHFGYSLESD